MDFLLTQGLHRFVEAEMEETRSFRQSAEQELSPKRKWLQIPFRGINRNESLASIIPLQNICKKAEADINEVGSLSG